MGLAICFSVEKFERQSAHGRGGQTTRFPFRAAKSIQSRAGKKPHRQERQPAYYVSEQQDIEHAVQMADRFNRIFMRTLRQLRDLRRYSPVTINNPNQVNIAANGGQQVNVSNQNSSNTTEG